MTTQSTHDEVSIFPETIISFISNMYGINILTEPLIDEKTPFIEFFKSVFSDNTELIKMAKIMINTMNYTVMTYSEIQEFKNKYIINLRNFLEKHNITTHIAIDDICQTINRENLQEFCKNSLDEQYGKELTFKIFSESSEDKEYISKLMISHLYTKAQIKYLANYSAKYNERTTLDEFLENTYNHKLKFNSVICQIRKIHKMPIENINFDEGDETTPEAFVERNNKEIKNKVENEEEFIMEPLIYYIKQKLTNKEFQYLQEIMKEDQSYEDVMISNKELKDFFSEVYTTDMNENEDEENHQELTEHRFSFNINDIYKFRQITITQILMNALAVYITNYFGSGVSYMPDIFNLNEFQYIIFNHYKKSRDFKKELMKHPLTNYGERYEKYKATLLYCGVEDMANMIYEKTYPNTYIPIRKDNFTGLFYNDYLEWKVKSS